MTTRAAIFATTGLTGLLNDKSVLEASRSMSESDKADQQDKSENNIKGLETYYANNRMNLYRGLNDLYTNSNGFIKSEDHIFSTLLPQMKLLNELQTVLHTMPNVTLPNLSLMLDSLVERTGYVMNNIKSVGEESTLYSSQQDVLDTFSTKYAIKPKSGVIPYKPLMGGAAGGCGCSQSQLQNGGCGCGRGGNLSALSGGEDNSLFSNGGDNSGGSDMSGGKKHKKHRKTHKVTNSRSGSGSGSGSGSNSDSNKKKEKKHKKHKKTKKTKVYKKVHRSRADSRSL